MTVSKKPAGSVSKSAQQSCWFSALPVLLSLGISLNYFERVTLMLSASVGFEIAAYDTSFTGCDHYGKYDAPVYRLRHPCHTGLHRPPGTLPDPGTADPDTHPRSSGNPDLPAHRRPLHLLPCSFRHERNLQRNGCRKIKPRECIHINLICMRFLGYSQTACLHVLLGLLKI